MNPWCDISVDLNLFEPKIGLFFFSDIRLSLDFLHSSNVILDTILLEKDID